MASPVYQTVSGNSGTAASFTMTEPTGTASGDGLIMFVFLDTNPSGWTPPASWIEKTTAGGVTVTDGTNTFQARIYAIERGASAPALGASWTGSVYFEWTLVRISGILAGGSAAFFESMTSATPGSGSAPDSPSNTPLSTNTLALSTAWSWAGFTGSQTVPTGYTSIRQVLNTGNAQAYKTLSTTTAEDPSAWGSGTTTAIWANTIIVASQAASGPTITSQPSDAQAAIGGTATFSVTASATGGGTLSYQWKLNGTNVSTGSGGTTSSYTTGTLATSDSGGLYTCDVTETGGTNAGTTTSSAATLSVGVMFTASGATIFSAANGTTVAPTWPTVGDNSGDYYDVLIVGMKPGVANGGSITAPSSPWSNLDTLTGAGGYSTTLGADTGNCNLWTYGRISDGTSSGTLSVTVAEGGANGVAWAKILRFKKPAGTTWNVVAVDGSDTTAGNVSITFGSNPGVDAGDMVAVAMCIPTDINTAGSRWSAEAVTATGSTFGTMVEQEEFASPTGNDIGGVAAYALTLTGPASAAPVFTATAGATSTNYRGPAVLVRLRATSSGGLTSTAAGSIARAIGGGGAALALIASSVGSRALPAGGKTFETLLATPSGARASSSSAPPNSTFTATPPGHRALSNGGRNATSFVGSPPGASLRPSGGNTFETLTAGAPGARPLSSGQATVTTFASIGAGARPSSASGGKSANSYIAAPVGYGGRTYGGSPGSWLTVASVGSSPRATGGAASLSALTSLQMFASGARPQSRGTPFSSTLYATPAGRFESAFGGATAETLSARAAGGGVSARGGQNSTSYLLSSRGAGPRSFVGAGTTAGVTTLVIVSVGARPGSAGGKTLEVLGASPAGAGLRSSGTVSSSALTTLSSGARGLTRGGSQLVAFAAQSAGARARSKSSSFNSSFVASAVGRTFSPLGGTTGSFIGIAARGASPRSSGGSFIAGDATYLHIFSAGGAPRSSGGGTLAASVFFPGSVVLVISPTGGVSVEIEALGDVDLEFEPPT